MQKLHLALWLLILCKTVSAQKNDNLVWDTPIIADSASTIMIPLSGAGVISEKMSWGWYRNILFYDFITDSSWTLFDTTVYIKRFQLTNRSTYYYQDKPEPFKTAQHVFYEVLNYDRNHTGKLTPYDPVILYVSDLRGRNLTQITSKDENVVGLYFFEAQGFVMIKIQIDENRDDDFDYRDTVFYFVKLDLKTMGLGKPVQIPMPNHH